MNTSNEIIIPLSKSKIWLSLFGCISFVLLGTCFIIFSEQLSRGSFANSILVISIGLAGVLFFAFLAFFYARKLSDTQPGLIIGEEGILDNSSGVAAGLILWSDLVEISVIEIHRQKLIMLFVSNPQDYIDKQKSSFKRNAMQLNFKMYETPLSITPNALKCDFNELLALIEENFEKHKPIQQDNLYGSINSSVNLKDFMKLFEDTGWKIRKASWHEFEVKVDWCEIVFHENNGVLFSGIIDEVKLTDFGQLLKNFDVTFSIELYNSKKELIKTISESQLD